MQSAIFEDSGSKPESADAVFQLSVPEGVEVQHSPTASSQDIDNVSLLLDVSLAMYFTVLTALFTLPFTNESVALYDGLRCH